MQYYVCNGQIPTETQDEGYTAFIEYMDSGAAGDKFDGSNWWLGCTCRSPDGFA